MENRPGLGGALRRYGFELLVVFLGVWLSLVAEGMRQAALERRDEGTSLERLARDMEYDLGDLEGNLNRAHAGFDGAARVLELRGSPSPPAEELARSLEAMGPCSYPVWNASEYAALKGAGRLNLVTDPDLRQRIVELYESRAFLDWVHQVDCGESEEVLALMAPYVEMGYPDQVRREGPDTAGWGGNRLPTIEAILDPAGLLSDRLLMNRVAKLASGRRFLIYQMELEREKTRTLRAEILESLDR